MPGEIQDARFRLPHTFAVQPDLVADEGPGKGILIGQNVERTEYDAILIGKHAETPNRSVWMDLRGAHVVYVMGKRRSGESYTLGAIAEGLVTPTWIRQGHTQQGVLVLDTMNVFLTMPFAVSDTHAESSAELRALRRWGLPGEVPRIELFAPSGTTIPRDLAASRVTLRASDLGPDEWCGLFEVDPFVDPMGHLITLLHSKLTAEGITDKGTGATSPPKPQFVLTDMLDGLERDRDLDGFPAETRQALGRRLSTLTRFALFGHAGLDVRQLLQPGQVSVLLLRDLDVEMRAVMVGLIVKRVMRLRAVSEQQERMIPVHVALAEKYQPSDPVAAGKERAKAAECAELAGQGLPRSWLVIDEAHNYVPARTAVPSRRPLKKYVDEGRNLGLSIVVATQQPSGLDPSLQRNADMLLIHALSHYDDITAAQGMINSPVPEQIIVDGKHRISGPKAFEALVRSLPLGYAIASTDRANRLFPLCIRPRCTVHGGGDY
jgi:hypothetical protein